MGGAKAHMTLGMHVFSFYGPMTIKPPPRRTSWWAFVSTQRSTEVKQPLPKGQGALVAYMCSVACQIRPLVLRVKLPFSKSRSSLNIRTSFRVLYISRCDQRPLGVKVQNFVVALGA